MIGVAEVLRWLAEREEDVPPSLIAEVQSAVTERTIAGAMSVPQALRRAAAALIAREDVAGNAVKLLAADALVTYACEAVAEFEAEALSRLV